MKYQYQIIQGRDLKKRLKKQKSSMICSKPVSTLISKLGSYLDSDTVYERFTGSIKDSYLRHAGLPKSTPVYVARFDQQVR